MEARIAWIICRFIFVYYSILYFIFLELYSLLSLLAQYIQFHVFLYHTLFNARIEISIIGVEWVGNRLKNDWGKS